MQHGLQNAQSGHDSAAGDAGSGDHGDAQHQDEGEHLAEADGLTQHHHDGDGAAGQGDGGTGQVNGGAQGADELSNGIGHAVLLGALHGDGDGGGGGLGADGGGVGGDHVLDQAEGVLLGDSTGNEVLDHDDDAVQDDDHDEDLDEGGHQLHDGAGVGQLGEDAVDVDGQQGDDDAGHQLVDDLSEVVHGVLQGDVLDGGHAQAQDEGDQQCAHDAHDGGHLDGEQGADHGLLRVLGVSHEHVGVDQHGEQGHIHKEGQGAGHDGGQVGDAGGLCQGLAGAGAQIGDTGGDEANDDQGNAEAEEVAEDAVVGGAEADDELTGAAHFLCGKAHNNTEDNGDDEFGQQAQLFLLLFHVFLWSPAFLSGDPPPCFFIDC